MRLRRAAAGLGAALAACAGPSDHTAGDFWDRQRRGANSQNTTVEPAYWAAASDVGVGFMRLVPDAWAGAGRDFLIGNADEFDGIPEADLAYLRSVLDEAAAAGIPVVLTMFSLPGARWRQLNDGEDDARLWRDVAFHEQAARFWAELAGTFRGHPAVVAYNPLNEPHPERAFGFTDPGSPRTRSSQDSVRGTAADLNRFYRTVVGAIRAEDASVPIILDAAFHAAPGAVRFLDPFDDPHVLYAFHFYEPWAYTTFRVNDGRYAYPDRMPAPGTDPAAWDAESLAARVRPVAEWAARHGIGPHRILVGEFGVDRRVPGAARYLSDAIALWNAHGWHWAFYAFRSDGTWGGMDYELGTEPLGAAYWEAVERGADPDTLKRRGENPLWEVLRKGLNDER